MKFTKPLKLSQSVCFTVLAVGMLVLSPAQSQGDVVEFGTIADQSQNFSFDFNTGDFTGTGAVFTQTGLNLSTGETFDFTATITHNAQVLDVFASNGSRLGDNDIADANGVAGRFGNGDAINIDVAVTSGNVVFDGFVNFAADRIAPSGGVGFNIDGVDYLRGADTNSDDDPRDGIVISGGIIAQSDVDIVFVDPRDAGSVEGIDLRGFALQFSANAVPEPSSLALFGLLGLGFATRRRK